MVEGPGVHRVAKAHRLVLLAKAFSATSPSGRFAEGAAAIDGRYLSLIEAHGKNIFYFFTKQKMKSVTVEDLPEDVIVVHIHFGMSGSFRTFPYPGPDPREKTRLRLENKKENLVSHLSAQLCVHGDIGLYRKRAEELGPDPLRPDADKERAWLKMQLLTNERIKFECKSLTASSSGAVLQKTKKTIGGIIMDQTFIAGIGNIYRTEILFVIGVHPDQPASSLSRSNFEDLWSNSVRLLEIGVMLGSITTVSQDEAGKPYSKLKAEDRRYVYNHSNCKRCGGPVLSWKLAARTVYACENCQPLEEVKVTDEEKVSVRKKVVSKAVPSGGTAVKQVTTTAKKSVTKKVAKPSPTLNLRKRKIRDGRIVEHQALKDIPCGGLMDFPDVDEVLRSSAKREAVSSKSAALVTVSSERPSVPLLGESNQVELQSKSQPGRRSSRTIKRVQRLGIDVAVL